MPKAVSMPKTPIRIPHAIRRRMRRRYMPVQGNNFKSVESIGSGGMGRVLRVEENGKRYALKLFSKEMDGVSSEKMVWMEAVHQVLAQDMCGKVELAEIGEGQDKIKLYGKVPELYRWGDLEIFKDDPIYNNLLELKNNHRLDELEADLAEKLSKGSPITLKYMLMEYIEGKSVEDLSEYLEENGRRIKEETMLAYVHGLSKIIGRFIKSKGSKGEVLSHLDIKQGNTLITDEGIVLIDFGTAKYFGQDIESIQDHNSPHSFWTMAPEHSKKIPNRKSDIFSIIVSAYLMRFGHHPYLSSLQDTREELEVRLKDGNEIREEDLYELKYGKSTAMVDAFYKSLLKDIGLRWWPETLVKSLETERQMVLEGYRQLRELGIRAERQDPNLEDITDRMLSEEDMIAFEDMGMEESQTKNELPGGNGRPKPSSAPRNSVIIPAESVLDDKSQPSLDLSAHLSEVQTQNLRPGAV